MCAHRTHTRHLNNSFLIAYGSHITYSLTNDMMLINQSHCCLFLLLRRLFCARRFSPAARTLQLRIGECSAQDQAEQRQKRQTETDRIEGEQT